jgi:hypothetical protein
LLEHLGEDIGCDEFIHDVVKAFGLQGWCERNCFSLHADEGLSFSRQRSVKVVKGESLYLFVERGDESESREAYEVESADMLRKLASSSSTQVSSAFLTRGRRSTRPRSPMGSGSPSIARPISAGPRNLD